MDGYGQTAYATGGGLFVESSFGDGLMENRHGPLEARLGFLGGLLKVRSDFFDRVVNLGFIDFV
jgi:hypothetical protein